MHLNDFWFALIAFLWTGYFFLEGFDFGIGVLTGLLARDAEERGTLLATIGPVWDGNEVWMLTAVGATFAAFPDWYAALCSGFYLPVLAVVVCLIVRGVALEYRAKRADARWRRTCDRAVFWSSLVCAFLWGALFATMARGVPIGADGNVTGGAGLIVNPDAAFGGLVSLTLFTLHGALFAALRCRGALRVRALRTARRVGGGCAVLALWAAFWLMVRTGDVVVLALVSVVVCALLVVRELAEQRREGWAFALSGLIVVLVTGTLFGSLYPALMPSATDPAWSLTVSSAAAGPYTLGILTWVAAFTAPVVMAYQAWTYWVFRKRIGGGPIGGGPIEGGAIGGGAPVHRPGRRGPRPERDVATRG
ncbi:cytochrome d ubiquinol oxidase subunit II [Streptomyces sp. NBC_00536]|uniref:cytochrome d ubiquinol oxidase subunit II n=1 Tax=Streptomyces sp. NBC_00536 TaxID=2975769 RepID=UPI002E7FE989|nr:cytochrome d ubiquinol oxidase subunit II [Streptomyces sp. NBC_00536]WUC80241.1 cytochrome d ubiquinol oxidase subunit II [Streptomyces sp. NBC_00536]